MSSSTISLAVGLFLILSGCRALPASSNCDAARALMTSLKLVAEVPSSPVAGGGGLVCEGDRTCCPAQTETALRHSAATDFHQAVRQSSHQLRLTLAHSATAIQGQLVRHVKASMAKTQTMFDELYKRVALLARSPVEQLFEQLERFVSSSPDDSSGGGDPADVSDAVAAFFDDLFPRLYGQSPRSVHQGPSLPANNVGVRFAQDYVDCLRHAQSELRPFGEIPRRLANSLARSLDAARALLSALDLGVRVLNATDHAELNGQCRDALLRATHCASCRSAAISTTSSSPHRVCRGLCSNVARGCLAAVADVDQPWNEWVDAMERLTTTLINPSKAVATADLGPHDILSSVDSRISEAVLYALENGPLLAKKVKRICGESLNSSSSVNLTGREDLAATDGDVGSSPPAANTVADGVDEEKEGLRKKLESLLPTLATARGFYANLPDAVCSQAGTPFQSLPQSEQTLCWNGQRYAEYTKPISGIGIGAQKYNAEVRVSRSDVDSHLVQLSDRLRHVRQVLISKTVSAPEPDSLVMADFGSGSGDGTGGPNGGGSSRSGGAWDDGSDAEPDEDGLPGGSDHTFADLDGSGSGQGPNEPNSNWNSKNDGGTKKPGSDGFELGPARDSVNTKPRVTVTDSSSGSSATRRVSVSAGWLVSLAFTLFYCSSSPIWRH